jgi:GxxExxY protein
MEMTIFYDGIDIGTRRVDFFVEDLIMVELKALIKLEDVHLAQAVNYCEAYDLPIGLLINFGSRSLDFKRVYNVNHSENKEFSSNNPTIIKSKKS